MRSITKQAINGNEFERKRFIKKGGFKCLKNFFRSVV